MIKMQMVRNQRNTVFYTRKLDSVHQIHRVRHHNVMMENLEDDIVHSFVGVRILAFQMDISADLEQSLDSIGCPLLVLTDQQKIYRLVDEKDMLYGIDRVWDLAHLSLINDLALLNKIDWPEISFSNRQIIINGKVYNLSSGVSDQVKP
jgi:hypothetical protein